MQEVHRLTVKVLKEFNGEEFEMKKDKENFYRRETF